MNTAHRVPIALREKFEAIALAADSFCTQHLNDEYRQVIHRALATLSRKRPSPLLKGQEISWAAGVVHAVGVANFLFDSAQTPHCKASDIYAYFGISLSTGQSYSKKIRDALDMGQWSPEWTLPSNMDDNPMAWLIQFNGFVVDARHLPLKAQEIAYAKGLIPYVPARKTDNT